MHVSRDLLLVFLFDDHALQGRARPELRREIRRHRGSLHVTALACAGARLRRGGQSPGAGPHAARAEAERLPGARR